MKFWLVPNQGVGLHIGSKNSKMLKTAQKDNGQEALPIFT